MVCGHITAMWYDHNVDGTWISSGKCFAGIMREIMMGIKLGGQVRMGEKSTSGCQTGTSRAEGRHNMPPPLQVDL